MLTRLLGVLTLLALLTLGALAVPAAATEAGGGHEELPSIDEVGSGSEVAREFFPQEAEEQPFTEWLVYPLLAVAIVAILVILFLYLKWQPNFDAEAAGSRRR